MSEAILWEPSPNRRKSENEDKLLEFTEENARAELSGTKYHIACGAILHLNYCFNLSSGGVVDDQGERWVWKTVKEFKSEAVKWVRGIFGFISPDRRTFDRAIAALVRLGVLIREWVKIPQGMTKVDVYAYRKGKNWDKVFSQLTVPNPMGSCPEDSGNVPVELGTDAPHTEQSSELPSEQPSDPIGCAALSPEPAEPEVEPFREKPVKRPKRVAADDDLWPLDVSKQPLTTPPVQEAAPVEQTEPTSEDKDSEASLNLLNRAGKTGWKFDPSRMTFVNAPGMSPRSVEAMAKQLQVTADELWAAVDHLIPV